MTIKEYFQEVLKQRLENYFTSSSDIHNWLVKQGFRCLEKFGTDDEQKTRYQLAHTLSGTYLDVLVYTYGKIVINVFLNNDHVATKHANLYENGYLSKMLLEQDLRELIREYITY